MEVTKKWVFLITPLLALAVGIRQLHLCSTEHLSRWKGGGFGMYSDSQPEAREIWVESAKGERWNAAHYMTSLDDRLSFYVTQILPNDENLQALLKAITVKNPSATSIEVFHLENARDVFTYKKIRSLP